MRLSSYNTGYLYSFHMIRCLHRWYATPLKIPIISDKVPLGFPSPAEGYIESRLDLTELLISHPSATFIAEAEGDSMVDLGIFSGDLLIVDRAANYQHQSIVVASINGELTCKILDYHNRQLLPANRSMSAIPLPEDIELIIEGVVLHVIKRNITANVRTR